MKKSMIMFTLGAMVLSANAQALKVNSAGNVGIGITPSYKLDVNGTGFFGKSDRITSAGVIIGLAHVGNDFFSIAHPAVYHTGSAPLYLGIPNARAYRVYASTINYITLTQGSDIRIKKNIQLCNSMLSKIRNIKTYTYNYADAYLEKFTPVQRKEMQGRNYGFLAQELQKVFPEFVHKDEDSMLSVSYISMIPVLTSAINELQNEVETRNATIDELQQKITSLEKTLLACCSNAKIQKSMQEFDLTGSEEVSTEEMKVYQNAPNPFNESTTIQCYIPEGIKKAELCIYDMSGSRLKCLIVAERGATSIQIQAGQLAAGVYTYLLTGDSKNSEAKQMILTK